MCCYSVMQVLIIGIKRAIYDLMVELKMYLDMLLYNVFTHHLY